MMMPAVRIRSGAAGGRSRKTTPAPGRAPGFSTVVTPYRTSCAATSSCTAESGGKWTCRSTKPGRRYLPSRSICSPDESRGQATSTIIPARTQTFVTGDTSAPVPSITRTFCNTNMSSDDLQPTVRSINIPTRATGPIPTRSRAFLENMGNTIRRSGRGLADGTTVARTTVALTTGARTTAAR